MILNYAVLDEISKRYGTSFYLLDTNQFALNFKELEEAFNKVYPNSHIAYSYKTNYTPALCKKVDDLGGYAEVVSDMEYELAKRIGVSGEKIIFNGPYKASSAVQEILLSGGIVNMDASYETDIIRKIAQDYPEKLLNVGIRCNFEIGEHMRSRFGFDVTSKAFDEALAFVSEYPNINLIGLHCHFASRCLDTWKNRAEKLIDLAQNRLETTPAYMDLGGGLFGKMRDTLKGQFDCGIPSYEDYAREAAEAFAKRYPSHQPMLFIEPGSALAGDVMCFAAKVLHIKEIRGKSIATLLGSVYNINPTLNRKNPPITVYHCEPTEKSYQNLDFAGYTCIESDYLYKGFKGKVAAGDYVVFDNVGSYSVVLKPPFILPNFAVVHYDEQSGQTILIKRQENFDDLFHTFIF